MVSIGGLFYPLRYVNFQGENVSGRECNIPGKNKARPTTPWFLPSKLMEMNMFRNLVGNFTTIWEVSPTSDVFILGYTIGSKAPPPKTVRFDLLDLFSWFFGALGSPYYKNEQNSWKLLQIPQRIVSQAPFFRHLLLLVSLGRGMQATFRVLRGKKTPPSSAFGLSGRGNNHTHYICQTR